VNQLLKLIHEKSLTSKTYFMEPTILPQQKTVKRSYKHYSINSQTVAAPVKKLEFFYIGKRSGVIDVLIDAFESGYAAENLENAKSMLRRLADQSGIFPDLIIADAALGYTGLLAFSSFLSADKGLKKAPFIIDASSIEKAELTRFKQAHFSDDIIFLRNYTRHALAAKANFWKKVKQRVNSPVLERNETLNAATLASSYSKRLFDISLAAAMLVVLSPLFFLIMIALRIESRGPSIYISKRAGRGYKIFNFYKFRTMEVGADQKINEYSHMNQYTDSGMEWPVFIKVNNDPRVTRFGMFLRNTSLDELPQLINVLKGDMSLVGNRPLPLYEAASLTTDQWAKRFMAPAGMTGLWQIKKRGREDMSAEERINLDINYADKGNFLFDLWIMANTPSALIQKSNA
jgi:lipopolysaccharide/colanic/teichoic acid biosynthesis glycosyltransferase